MHLFEFYNNSIIYRITSYYQAAASLHVRLLQQLVAKQIVKLQDKRLVVCSKAMISLKGRGQINRADVPLDQSFTTIHIPLDLLPLLSTSYILKPILHRTQNQMDPLKFLVMGQSARNVIIVSMLSVISKLMQTPWIHSRSSQKPRMAGDLQFQATSEDYSITKPWPVVVITLHFRLGLTRMAVIPSKHTP